MTADEWDFGPDSAANRVAGEAASDAAGRRSGEGGEDQGGQTPMTGGMRRNGAPGAGSLIENGETDDADETGADGVPEDPSGYAIKFAKETRVDAEMLNGFRRTAHELGLSRGQAQELARMYETHAARAGERAALEREKTVRDAVARWEAEITGSPAYARERADIQAALRQYGDPELYRLLDQTRLGAHPKMWAFMANIGRRLGEARFHGHGGGRERSAAEVLYPNQGK